MNRCTNPRCNRDDEPAVVLDGAYLCHRCRSRLERNIAEFPSLYDDLALQLARPESARERVSGSKNPNIEINEPAAEARREIRAVLAQLAGIIVADRGVNPPATGEVQATAPFLVTHADWLTHQDFADHWYERIDDIRRSAWYRAYPTGRKRFNVGPCITKSCDGTLTTTITATDDLLPSSLDCDTCALTLTADQWAKLGKAMTTAADLARLFRVAIGTVYCWASEDDWRRSDPRVRPVRYHLEDARRSYESRRRLAS